MQSTCHKNESTPYKIQSTCDRVHYLRGFANIIQIDETDRFSPIQATTPIYRITEKTQAKCSDFLGQIYDT